MVFPFQADSISGFHSNTHIPVVIGAQMRYEVTGDALYKVKQIMLSGELNYSLIDGENYMRGYECKHKS